MINYPKLPEIRSWPDAILLDVYEEEYDKSETGIIEHWEYKARLRSEILRRMRGSHVFTK